MAIIFDLDGTLADASHRMHWIQSKPKNWKMFFEECDKDLPIKDMHHIFGILGDVYSDLYIVSGRSEIVRDKTIQWLNNYSLYSKELYMRKENDFRPDWKVKQEIYEEHFKAKNISVQYVFDDRDQVVNMWRANGLRCLQVAAGNF